MTKNIIGFHYTLKNAEGQLIDTSEGQAPLLVLVGSGHIIPALEEELVKMKVGDKKDVEIKAADGYGEAVDDLKITVQKSQFPDGNALKIGDQFQVNEDPNAPIFTVVEIEGDNVHVDGNHPMAGVDLFFSVELTQIREATEEEISHGHAHGEGGHHH